MCYDEIKIKSFAAGMSRRAQLSKRPYLIPHQRLVMAWSQGQLRDMPVDIGSFPNSTPLLPYMRALSRESHTTKTDSITVRLTGTGTRAS